MRGLRRCRPDAIALGSRERIDRRRAGLRRLRRRCALSAGAEAHEEIAERLGAGAIEVERAETPRRPLDSGGQSEERTPATFWARSVSLAPAAMWIGFCSPKTA